MTRASRFLTGWVTRFATHDSIPAGRSIKTQKQTTTPKQAGPGGAGIEEGRRRHQPAGTPGLYRLMPTPGYRLSDRTGISDLVISADSDECFTPEGFVCAPELKIVVQVHAVQIGGCFAQWSPWWR